MKPKINEIKSKLNLLPSQALMALALVCLFCPKQKHLFVAEHCCQTNPECFAGFFLTDHLQALVTSHKRPPRLNILGGRLREVPLYNTTLRTSMNVEPFSSSAFF